jgi:hypothetical protein
MRCRCVPTAVRDPLMLPKPLPEGAAGPAALALTLGGAAPHLPRWAVGSPSLNSTGKEFNTADPVLESAARPCNYRSSAWLFLLQNLLIIIFVFSKNPVLAL